jgi:hypothetical protein
LEDPYHLGCGIRQDAAKADRQLGSSYAVLLMYKGILRKGKEFAYASSYVKVR